MDAAKVKKIFILTGEASGDKLASKVISELNKLNSNIEYLSVGGENLKKLGIRSIYDLKEITYLGFTNVLFNIFKIKKKINETVKAIENFKPDILFTVDSPDFTLRVAERIKIKNPGIKTIHYVAPQVWVWREGRVKKIKKFIDHILLLFEFEKKYFDEENINNTFVGHPLIERNQNNKTIIDNFLPKNKKIISIFPGSRNSETNVLLPILLDFVKLMNQKHKEYFFYIHATEENKNLIVIDDIPTEFNNWYGILPSEEGGLGWLMWGSTNSTLAKNLLERTKAKIIFENNKTVLVWFAKLIISLSLIDPAG